MQLRLKNNGNTMRNASNYPDNKFNRGLLKTEGGKLRVYTKTFNLNSKNK